MTLLLDTQILLWASILPTALPRAAFALMNDPRNTLLFSAASIWEVAIKFALRRDDFDTDPRVLRRALLDNGYVELPITGQHAVSIDALPLLHKDPFDRALVAQAMTNRLHLMTTDKRLADYSDLVEVV